MTKCVYVIEQRLNDGSGNHSVFEVFENKDHATEYCRIINKTRPGDEYDELTGLYSYTCMEYPLIQKMP